MQFSVGEQLKQARLARNATIEDVSRAIHIRPYFIEVLEDDRFSEIPSLAQAKGFIRLYAGWLTLPAKSLLDLLEGKSEPEAEELTPANLSTGSEIHKDIQVFDRSDIEISPIEEKTDLDDLPLDQESEIEPTADPLIQPVIGFQSTSQELFHQIGEQLRSCRLKLDISVEDIEKLTRIRARYLLDMEAGNFNDIPSLVQARGLLNGYAAFLNLDSDSLLGTFAEALQKRRLELLPVEPKTPSKKKKKAGVPVVEKTGIRRFLSVDFLVGSFTIVGLVIFGIWSATQVMSSRNKTVSKPPAIAEILMQNPTSDTARLNTATPEPTEIIRNPESIGQIPTNVPADTGSAANESPTPPVPSLGSASMQVYIVPNQRVFLQVTTGKKVAFLGRTVPGNAYPFTSDERIEVVSGNAAALQIYYNQRDLGTLGLPGQPLRLIFSKEGISTPTQAKTTLPTSTMLATLTLRPTATQVIPTVTPFIP
jgi:cytoskeleton protein RodZ